MIRRRAFRCCRRMMLITTPLPLRAFIAATMFLRHMPQHARRHIRYMPISFRAPRATMFFCRRFMPLERFRCRLCYAILIYRHMLRYALYAAAHCRYRRHALLIDFLHYVDSSLLFHFDTPRHADMPHTRHCRRRYYAAMPRAAPVYIMLTLMRH